MVVVVGKEGGGGCTWIVLHIQTSHLRVTVSTTIAVIIYVNSVSIKTTITYGVRMFHSIETD